MNERSELLAAVLAAPDDDTPRLVFADWFEDHGEPERAEFIRMHIKTGDVSNMPRLRNIIRSLFTSKKPWQWHSQFGGPYQGLTLSGLKRGRIKVKAAHVDNYLDNGDVVPRLVAIIERGFVSEIHGPLIMIYEHGPAICHINPVTSVVVTDLHAMVRGEIECGDWEFRPPDRPAPGPAIIGAKGETPEVAFLRQLRRMASIENAAGYYENQ